MWKQIVGLLTLASFPIVASTEEPSPPPTNKASTQTEWQQLCADHKVLAWYMDAIDHPEALESVEDATNLPMLHLMELRGDNDLFDRKTSPIRKNIEADSLADIEQVMAGEPENTPVRLLGLGCTGYLEDWHIVGQLIRKGRTHIDLTIVDKNLIKECVDGLTQLSQALQEEGVQLTLSFYDSLAACKSSKFHCAYAVDYYPLFSFQENTWNTLTTVRKLLATKGHLFVSYLQESLRIDSQGKLQVLTSSPENQVLRKTISSAQRSNPRAKENSLRFQLVAANPLFITGPLLYALSDLSEEGYRDINVFAFSMKRFGVSESDLSTLVSDMTGEHASIHWQKLCYVHHKQEDRRDMVILSMPGVEIHDLLDQLHHDILVLGTILPEQGHWIIHGDQLGIWDISGLGVRKPIFIPDAHKNTAKKMIDALFAEGGHWY
jgi:hypothetical protein